MTGKVIWIVLHALATLVFFNRYVAGAVLKYARKAKGGSWDEARDDYEPTVTVIIPMFNEGAAVQETLRSILASDYPKQKLRVICVDDQSRDNSADLAEEVARESGGRLTVLRNAVNLGKRCSIIRATRQAQSEIIVSVDSDVIVDSDAIRQLIRRFTDERIAAVGGWVDVRNKHENWLTRMQTVKYWYSYFYMKNLEWAFRRIMCLSGCLTAYRREVLIELEPELENREILGVPIKYGEDRFLTRQIVKAGYLTTMTLDARCQTFVPTNLSGYFSQQLRWRRSNIVDYAGGVSHVWRLNPIIAIHFFSLFSLMLVYPVAMIRAIAAHKFFGALVLHMAIVAFFGVWYRISVRKYQAEDRVGALWFVPLSLLMPITYGILTPLALFTLDSGSWETRAHQPEPEVPAAETGTIPVELVDVIETRNSVGADAVVHAVSAEAVSRAHLPAA